MPRLATIPSGGSYSDHSLLALRSSTPDTSTKVEDERVQKRVRFDESRNRYFDDELHVLPPSLQNPSLRWVEPHERRSISMRGRRTAATAQGDREITEAVHGLMDCRQQQQQHQQRDIHLKTLLHHDDCRGLERLIAPTVSIFRRRAVQQVLQCQKELRERRLTEIDSSSNLSESSSSSSSSSLEEEGFDTAHMPRLYSDAEVLRERYLYFSQALRQLAFRFGQLHECDVKSKGRKTVTREEPLLENRGLTEL